MATEMIDVLNTATGAKGRIAKKFFDHPAFNPGGKILVEVKPGTKPYASKTYKAQTPEQFKEKHPERVVQRGRKNQTENPEPSDVEAPKEDEE